jgi:hypothetical protein
MSERTLTQEAVTALGQEVGDALDLAIASGAPLPILEKLGAASGLLRALAEVPNHVLLPAIVPRARRAIAAWNEWKGRGLKRAAA